MKAFILFGILLAGCQGSDISKIKNCLPGIYARHFEALYSRGDDTLYITQLNRGNAWAVVRKSTFYRTKNKTAGQPQQKIESWSVIYNERDKDFLEQRTERLLVPLPDSSQLRVGGSTYFKIK